MYKHLASPFASHDDQVSGLLGQLQSPDENVQANAAAALCNLTCSDEGRNAIRQKPEAVQQLVSSLEYAAPNAQVDVILALGNLTMRVRGSFDHYSRTGVRALVASGAIPQLVTHLTNANKEVRDAATLTLFKIGLNSPGRKMLSQVRGLYNVAWGLDTDARQSLGLSGSWTLDSIDPDKFDLANAAGRNAVNAFYERFLEEDDRLDPLRRPGKLGITDQREVEATIRGMLNSETNRLTGDEVSQTRKLLQIYLVHLQEKKGGLKTAHGREVCQLKINAITAVLAEYTETHSTWDGATTSQGTYGTFG